MSLKLVKQSLNSPFQLQRSMVDQGGAYESGGFSGQSQFSDGGAAAAISSIGSSVAAGINSITPGDKNKMNEKKAARLEVRSAKTEKKKELATATGNTSKTTRMEDRNKRVEGRLSDTNKKIKEYKESKNPTLESSIKPVTPKETSKETSKEKLKEITDFTTPINQKKKTNPSQEGPGNSYMIGLPKKVVKENKENVKKQSTGPRGDYTEKKLPAPKMKRY